MMKIGFCETIANDQGRQRVEIRKAKPKSEPDL